MWFLLILPYILRLISEHCVVFFASVSSISEKSPFSRRSSDRHPIALLTKMSSCPFFLRSKNNRAFGADDEIEMTKTQTCQMKVSNTIPTPLNTVVSAKKILFWTWN